MKSNTMKKVFISGRIRDMPDLSHFHTAAEFIQTVPGYTPVVPIRLIDLYPYVPEDTTDPDDQWVQGFWLRESLKLLLSCDAIYFCPGRLSAGMVLEDTVARAIGLEVVCPPIMVS